MRYQVFKFLRQTNDFEYASRIYDDEERRPFTTFLHETIADLKPGQFVTIRCYEDNPPAQTAVAA